MFTEYLAKYNSAELAQFFCKGKIINLNDKKS